MCNPFWSPDDEELYCSDCAPDDAEEGPPDVESDYPFCCHKCLKPLECCYDESLIADTLNDLRESLKMGRIARNKILTGYKGTYWEGARVCDMDRKRAEELCYGWYFSLSDKERRFLKHYLNWTEE